MKKHYREELGNLKETVLRMGGLVEQMTHRAIQALVERKTEMLAEVDAMESQVNQLHIDIDEICLEMIALRQPTAADLRFIAAAMKINTDMERIGDQAINISERAQFLLTVPPVKPLIDIPRMAEIAKGMLRDALDAFVNGNDALAYDTIHKDDLVDQLKDQVFRELLTYMMADPGTIPRALDLILVSRHLERIADHATNICEDVIFMVKGKDIRHQGPLA
ncbi:MAG: phosphate signaling complex protein PhoU [Deltaproteobacteria bacterium]|nr:phosphate signaling complex protein PhoU [Deltaproteobacteria bacterium]PWB67392.1 MAG: phosphate transport system regulatory protein PhoU [Deltaproteobacteria bacterium]